MSFSFGDLVLGPCIAAFGEAAQGRPIPLYTPVGSSQSYAIDGIFDDGFRSVEDSITGQRYTSAEPLLGVRLSQFPAGIAPRQNGAWLIRGSNYLVKEVRPDSHGGAELVLAKAS